VPWRQHRSARSETRRATPGPSQLRSRGAMHGRFGGFIASGWYFAAILVRLFADSSEQSLAGWWFNGSLDKRIHTTPSRSGEARNCLV
jgi:acyl dehydratase